MKDLESQTKSILKKIEQKKSLRHRQNRRFYLVLGTLLFVCMILSPLALNHTQKGPSPLAPLAPDTVIWNTLERQSSDRNIALPENWEKRWMSADALTRYFGRSFPKTLGPLDLLPHPNNESDRAFFFTPEGKAGYDRIHYFFAEDPESTDYLPLMRSFSVNISRLSLEDDCIYIEEKDMKPSLISGCLVQLGKRKMSYGPYDPDTHKPSGYTDFLLATWEKDGVLYEVTADNLTCGEVVDIVRTLLR